MSKDDGNENAINVLTLRDYFAAAAMPVVATGLRDTPLPKGMTIGQHAAQLVYTIAERMLAERAK